MSVYPPDAPPLSGDAEVTSEMIDAGGEVLEAFYMGDGLYDLRAPCLTAMYRAMRGIEKIPVRTSGENDGPGR